MWDDISEEEFVRIVEKVTKNLVFKLQFAYFTPEDLKQEAMIVGMKGLAKWDKVRPLENFLSVHIKNQLLNLRRKNFSRHEPPCKKCPFYCPKSVVHINECELFEDKGDCDKWKNWIKRNEIKENIAKPGNIHIISDEEEASIQDHSDLDDYIDGVSLRIKIEEELPLDYRADYLRFMSGVSIPKYRMDKLKAKIREIVGVEDE